MFDKNFKTGDIVESNLLEIVASHAKYKNVKYTDCNRETVRIVRFISNNVLVVATMFRDDLNNYIILECKQEFIVNRFKDKISK